MIKPIREALSILAIGKISPIVESDKGFHVLQLMAKKKERKLSFGEVKDKIYKKLFAQRVMEKFNSIVQDLKKTAYIEKKMDIFS